MPHLTKETILEVQREAFANASDMFELNPTLATWRELERQSVAWMRVNVMQEEPLVALLTPHHTDGWSEVLGAATQKHSFTVKGVAALAERSLDAVAATGHKASVEQTRAFATR